MNRRVDIRCPETTNSARINDCRRPPKAGLLLPTQHHFGRGRGASSKRLARGRLPRPQDPDGEVEASFGDDLEPKQMPMKPQVWAPGDAMCGLKCAKWKCLV